MGIDERHERDEHERLTSEQGQLTSAKLWREVEASRELLAVAVALQDELSALHAQLAERYQPTLEEQAHRLSIERDEALVGWGRAILGLEALGVTTKLHFPEQGTPPARACGVTPSWFQAEERELMEGEADARVLGSAQWRSAERGEPSSASQGGEAQGSQEPEANRGATLQLVAELLSEGEEEELIDDDAPEDPGVAEAERVLLTPSDLRELQDKLSQQKGWAHQAPVESSTQAWRDDAEALALRLGAPRAQLDASHIKQALLDIEAEVECCQQWGEFDREVQNAVLSLITSRLRKLQGHIGSNLFDQDRVAKLFRRLTRYSSDFRPGFVQALSRDKTPSNDSWDADERDAWQRIEELLDIKRPLPKLSEEQEEALSHLKTIAAAAGSESFSQDIREAVSKCLSAGFPSESPHLTEWVIPHLSQLSGRRFKSLRQAQSQLA